MQQKNGCNDEDGAQPDRGETDQDLTHRRYNGSARAKVPKAADGFGDSPWRTLIEQSNWLVAKGPS
jgi:hypothetical protein